MREAMVVFLMLSCFPAFGADEGPEAVIDGLLTSFHQAASDANGDLYFSLFAEGAVFMGTDATERWTVADLKAYAEPYFSQGRGWTYRDTERHVFVSDDGQTAWFDELLWNEKYGTLRGTGVFVLTDGHWRIAQYNLAFPIPNDLAAGFASQIIEFEAKESR